MTESRNAKRDFLDSTGGLKQYSFKYTDVWQRVKTKVLCSIRISRFIEELADKRLHVGLEVKDYLRTKAGLFHRPTVLQSKTLPWGIIHPNHKFRQRWNIFIGFLLIYTAIVTPFVIAFYDSVTFDTFFVIDTTINFFYFCDLIINCSTAFHDKDAVLKVSRKEIALNYLKGWMIMDIVACLPISLVPNIINQISGNSYNKLVRLFRLRSIPKLFRFSKIIKLLKTYKTSFLLEHVQIFLNINHSVMRLYATIAGIVIGIHVVGCFWYISSSFSSSDYETWIFRYNYEDSNIFTLYITSLYWAITTITSVGYGDIVPFSDAELIFTILWICATMYFLSFTVSSLSTVITMIDNKKNNLDLKLTMVDDYAKEAKISKAIKQKMQNRIRVTNDRLPLSIDEEEKLMREIPKDLRFKIACNMHNGFLNRCLFFKDKDKEFISCIALFLQPWYFSKNDCIINKGEIATDIYFVLHGAVNFVGENDQTVFKIIAEGQEFGDIEVLLKCKRVFSALSSCESTLLVMKEEYVRKIKEEYPGIWNKMKEKAYKRLASMNLALAEALVLKRLKIETLKQIKSTKYKELINVELEKVKKSNPLPENSAKEEGNFFTAEMAEQAVANLNSIKEIKKSLDDLKDQIQKVLLSKA